MILVIGGSGAGKRNFVCSVLGYCPEQLTQSPDGGGPVLYNLQDLDPLPGEDVLLNKAVVICNEVGCGVVPMDRRERERREAVGRLCCTLAARAQEVYRVSCGLAMRLK